MSKCIKTPVCGSCYTSCDGSTDHVIFKSLIQNEKFLSLTITNTGDCDIRLFKNEATGNPILRLLPGCTTSFVGSVRELVFVCQTCSGCVNPVCSICWKGCAINKVTCLCEDCCNS